MHLIIYHKKATDDKKNRSKTGDTNKSTITKKTKMVVRASVPPLL